MCPLTQPNPCTPIRLDVGSLTRYGGGREPKCGKMVSTPFDRGRAGSGSKVGWIPSPLALASVVAALLSVSDSGQLQQVEVRARSAPSGP